MSRNYDFIETQESIRGMFWLPDDTANSFPGILHLPAGKSPRLETSIFTTKEHPGLFSDEPWSLNHSDPFTSFPAKKIILGHDEHRNPVTLIDCLSNSSHNTSAMVSRQFECRAAIFGVHLKHDDLLFQGMRVHFDHIDEWVGRRMFEHHTEKYVGDDGHKRISKIIIPFADNLDIPLQLPSYEFSRILSSWSINTGNTKFSLTSRGFLDLHFEKPKTWLETLDELYIWRWFFSLAARTTVDVRHLALYRDDHRFPVGRNSMEPNHVWIKRSHSRKVRDSRRNSHSFHFTFPDIEKVLPAVIGNWQRMQERWGTVLHRYFAVSDPRKLWLNEEFLFLAQAVESLHRARTGANGRNVDLGQAAKQAYLNAPSALQTLLGDRGTFTTQFRKTRNYWTHHGEPSPQNDSQVLDEIPLNNFNEKLRWIIESAILQEMGVPEHCVSKVWSEQWRQHIVEFE